MKILIAAFISLALALPVTANAQSTLTPAPASASVGIATPATQPNTEKSRWPAVSVAVSIFSLVVACIAAFISWSNAQRQATLTARLKDRDVDYERKRFVVDLWDKMTDVSELHADKNGEHDEGAIFDALNTLELVATCWHNDIVDKRMVFLAFGKAFRLRYAEVAAITRPLPILRLSGPQLLDERPLIAVVKGELDTWFNRQVHAKEPI